MDYLDRVITHSVEDSTDGGSCLQIVIRISASMGFNRRLRLIALLGDVQPDPAMEQNPRTCSGKARSNEQKDGDAEFLTTAWQRAENYGFDFRRTIPPLNDLAPDRSVLTELRYFLFGYGLPLSRARLVGYTRTRLRLLVSPA